MSDEEWFGVTNNDDLPQGQIGLDPDDESTRTINNRPIEDTVDRPVVVDEDGAVVMADYDGEKAELAEMLQPKNFDIRNFHAAFHDNTELGLAQLLSMQSNANPLKKGGAGLAYRCDLLILRNRQKFTVSENTLFDILIGEMSTHPDDESYIIRPKKVNQYLEYSDSSYLYKLFKTAVSTLKDKPLQFDFEQDGKKRIIAIPWYESLTYMDKGLLDDGDVYISFAPSKFFKMLVISSNVTHGAYTPIYVSSKINGKYTRQLYYFLASKKNYRAYATAPTGQIRIPLTDLLDICGAPHTYRPTDIKRRILEPAVNEFNKIEGIDFKFDYQLVKKKGTKKFTDVDFFIENSRPRIQEENNTPALTSGDIAVIEILQAQGFSAADANELLEVYNDNGRTLVFLTQAVVTLSQATDVKNKKAYMKTLLKNGLTKRKSSKNQFNNFEQRERTSQEMSDLEKALVRGNQK